MSESSNKPGLLGTSLLRLVQTFQFRNISTLWPEIRQLSLENPQVFAAVTGSKKCRRRPIIYTILHAFLL